MTALESPKATSAIINFSPFYLLTSSFLQEITLILNNFEIGKKSYFCVGVIAMNSWLNVCNFNDYFKGEKKLVYLK